MQHLQVAVGVAEGQCRATADDRIDAHRFAWAVIVVRKLGRTQDSRVAAARLELRHKSGADHLFRWNAVNLFGEGAHEHHFAA
ncbi:hypothetical protein D3C81_2147750 [compost metagenome]